MKLSRGIGLVGILLLLSFLCLGILIYVPLGGAMDLAEAEDRTIQCLKIFGPDLGRVQQQGGEVIWQDFSWLKESQSPSLVQDGVLEGDQTLAYGGYLFRLVPEGKGWGILAWPQEFGGTGHGMFFYSRKGEILETRNQKKRYSGLEIEPRTELASPGHHLDGKLFSKDGQNWKPVP